MMYTETMKQFQDKITRRTIYAIVLLLATLPSLIADSGFGILPIERGTVAYDFIRGVYELFGSFGWTDYGNVYLHFILLGLSVYLFWHRKSLKLNWVDYLLMIPSILLSAFLVFALFAILSVVAHLP